MAKPIPQLDTPGQIARDEGVPLYRVTYVLNTRPHIQPVAKAGNLRLFDRHAVQQIREELAKINGKRHPEGSPA